MQLLHVLLEEVAEFQRPQVLGPPVAHATSSPGARRSGLAEPRPPCVGDRELKQARRCYCRHRYFGTTGVISQVQTRIRLKRSPISDDVADEKNERC